MIIVNQIASYSSKSRTVKWRHIRHLLRPLITASPTAENRRAVTLECCALGIHNAPFGSNVAARQFVRYRLCLIEEMLRS